MSDQTRADELELWDRIQDRWNKHVGRQIKIAASVVSFAIIIIGFLGVRSLDSMVKETVQEGVKQALTDVRTDIDKYIQRLSNQLDKKLTTMISEVAMLEQQAVIARKLVAQMEEDAKRFEGIENDLNKRIENIDGQLGILFGKITAESLSREITAEAVTKAMFDRRKALMHTIDGLDKDKAIALMTKIEIEFPEIKPFMARYTDPIRAADAATGRKAKKLLKQAVPLTAKSRDDADKWQAAIDSL